MNVLPANREHVVIEAGVVDLAIEAEGLAVFVPGLEEGFAAVAAVVVGIRIGDADVEVLDGLVHAGGAGQLGGSLAGSLRRDCRLGRRGCPPSGGRRRGARW